jgi:regulator of replication initiation timing
MSFDELKNEEVLPKDIVGVKTTISELNTDIVFNSFFNIQFPYFICLDFSKFEKYDQEHLTTSINNLVQLSFSLYYAKVFNSPIFVTLNEKNNSETKNIISQIKIELKKQGYSNIDFYELVESNTINFDHKDCFIASDKLGGKTSEKFYDSFLNESIIDKTYFICANNEKRIEISNQITGIEKRFKNEQNGLYNLYTNIQNLTNQNRKIVFENNHVKSQLENEILYRKLLKVDANKIISWYKTENKNIKDWYIQQYESLPSWYKKIGHLIKKISNKR